MPRLGICVLGSFAFPRCIVSNTIYELCSVDSTNFRIHCSLIAIGNTLFLVGLCFSIGFKRTLSIFTRRDRIRGSVCFFLGIVLVVLRWGLIGIALEAFGFLNLFGNFLPTVLTFARQIPYIGPFLDAPFIAPTVDFLAGKTTRPKYSV